MVEHLRNVVSSVVRNGRVDDYHNAMRMVTREITRQVHVRASRLRILLLLSDLLPQPLQDGMPAESSQTLGFDAFYEVLNIADGMDVIDFEATSGFMDFDWATANVGPLSQLSLDILAFLENVLFDDWESSQEVPDDTVPQLPPEVSPQARQTHVTANASRVSRSRSPTRTSPKAMTTTASTTRDGATTSATPSSTPTAAASTFSAAICPQAARGAASDRRLLQSTRGPVASGPRFGDAASGSHDERGTIPTGSASVSADLVKGHKGKNKGKDKGSSGKGSTIKGSSSSSSTQRAAEGISTSSVGILRFVKTKK